MPASAAEVALAAQIVSSLFLAAPGDELRAVLADPGAAAEWPTQDWSSRDALARVAAEGPGTAEELVDDHFQLFVGPGRGNACPYESVHVSEDNLLYGEETFAVRDMYAHLGLVAGGGDRGPDDHIGLEFGFVAACCERLSRELLAEERAAVAQLLRVFLAEHLDRFAPTVLAMVAEHARTSTYRALPVLARGVLAGAHELVD